MIKPFTAYLVIKKCLIDTSFDMVDDNGKFKKILMNKPILFFRTHLGVMRLRDYDVYASQVIHI